MEAHHNLKPAMKWPLLRPIVIGIVLIAIAGCGDSDSGSGSGQPGVVVGSPAPQTAAASCAGADLSGLKSIVYVSPQGADDAGCGATTAAACKTIQQGIANCAAAGCGVLVRHGLYPTSATIALRDAVSVYGGCRFDGEADRKYRSVIQASPAPGTPALSADGVNSPAVLSGLVVLGKDETADGTASIAMTVSNSSALTLTRSTLAAGKGGEGAPGSTPTMAGVGQDGAKAAANFRAGIGGQACAGTPPASAGRGGAGADLNSNDSYGCFAACGCRNNNSGNTGPSGENGSDSGSVKGGGGGGAGAEGCSCNSTTNSSTDGGSGGSGSSGSCAVTGGAANLDILGSFVSTSWTPSQGVSGRAGDVGSGGGGGGAGGRNVWAHNFTGTDYDGYAGGGGGGGGCGGQGGQGGQQGGASIALVLYSSKMPGSTDTNSIIPGLGGRGGDGGNGARGGPGGTGQTGWPGFDQVFTSSWCGDNFKVPGGGGKGGDGGAGGAGSGAAGGNGGPSVGIALVKTSQAPTAGGVYPPALPATGGDPGRGGQGGAANCRGADGATGAVGGGKQIVDYDLPLASILLAGQQLAKGQSIPSPNGKVLLAMQGDDNFCLYSAGNALWCTGTNGEGIPAALMQTDGNLCLYPTDGSHSPWCSNTAGHPNAYLIVQDSGYVQIIDGGSVLWSQP